MIFALDYVELTPVPREIIKRRCVVLKLVNFYTDGKQGSVISVITINTYKVLYISISIQLYKALFG